MQYPVSIIAGKAEEELKRAVVDISNKYQIPSDLLLLIYKNVLNYIYEEELTTLSNAHIEVLNELDKIKKEDESCQSSKT